MAAALVGLARGTRLAAVAAVALTTSAGLTAPGAIERALIVEALDIVVFVGAMILVAGAWERSGLLAAIADRLLAKTLRPRVLLGATYLGAVAVTTVFNLDTTAVMFTPLALLIASSAGQPAVPFALASIFGANFGSMLLPSSNLTNLVLWRNSKTTATAFASTTVRPAVVAVVITGVVLLGSSRLHHGPVPKTHRRDLDDPRLAVLGVAAVGAVLVGLVTGVDVGASAGGAAIVLLLARPGLRRCLPSPVLLAALASLLVAASLLGGSIDGGSDDNMSPRLLAVVGALGAAAVTNLVAVVVLESYATTDQLRTGLLIGVNLGVGLTPTASLATVLWADSLRRAGHRPPLRAYLIIGGGLSVVLVGVTPLLL